MANTKSKIKSGMKGSNNGKSRWNDTETLKEQSKHTRRKQGKIDIKDQLK